MNLRTGQLESRVVKKDVIQVSCRYPDLSTV